MSDAPSYIMEDLPWDDSVVFRPRGSLDIYTAPEFRSALDELKEKGRKHFVLDLSGIEYIDSTGLGSLASFMDKVKKDQGSLRLAGLRGVVHKAFVFTNLLDLFNISDTAEEAIQNLGEEIGD